MDAAARDASTSCKEAKQLAERAFQSEAAQETPGTAEATSTYPSPPAQPTAAAAAGPYPLTRGAALAQLAVTAPATAVTPSATAQSKAETALMTAVCQSSGVAVAAGDFCYRTCSSSSLYKVEGSDTNARRSLSRNGAAAKVPLENAAAVSSVTRCSPRQVRKTGATMETHHQQQHQRRNMTPSSDTGAAGTFVTLLQSLRPSAAPSGAATGKSVSLKRKGYSSSGKSRSGGGRNTANIPRKHIDTQRIRFDASWFLPESGWPHRSLYSSSSNEGTRKKLKYMRRKEEGGPCSMLSHCTFPLPIPRGRVVGDCEALHIGQGRPLDDCTGRAALIAEEANLTQLGGVVAEENGRTRGESSVGEETKNFIYTDGDTVLSDSIVSEDDDELDVYLSDMEAAARALDDSLTCARRISPHQLFRCCVCGLVRRSPYSSKYNAKNDQASSEADSGSSTTTVDDNNNKQEHSDERAGMWEPLCTCMPRSFGQNTLQGRAGKNTLLCPPAATPLRYTLHTLVLKPPALSSDSNGTVSHSHQGVNSGGSGSGGGSTSSSNNSNSSGCSASGGTDSSDHGSAVCSGSGDSSGCSNFQSNGGANSGNSSQRTERFQESCCAQAGSRSSQGSSSHLCIGNGRSSCKSDSGNACCNASTDNSTCSVICSSTEFGIEEDGGGEQLNTSQKRKKRFCRWRDLATLQTFCAPLEQLHDSLAATVASAAAAGAAAGRSVVFLPRLFWDRNTDCYVASCLGYYCGNNGNSSCSSSGGECSRSEITARAERKLHLLQKRFSVGFLGDAKAHFYACMWLNWHYEQASSLQRRQQQLLQQEYVERQHQQLLHVSKGKCNSSLISPPGGAGQLWRQQSHGVATASWKDSQKGGGLYRGDATSLWRQQKQEGDMPGSEDETEEERKARLRQESIARQKRHKLERQQWRRQQARLARLLQQQQEQQQQQAQLRSNPKNYHYQHQQQRGHSPHAAAGRACSAAGEQGGATGLPQENRVTRAAGATSFSSQQQRSSGEAAIPCTRDGTPQQTGRAINQNVSSRKHNVELAVGTNAMGMLIRDTSGVGFSQFGVAPSASEHGLTEAGAVTSQTGGDQLVRAEFPPTDTPPGALCGSSCNGSVGGSRIQRRSDGVQTPPLTRGSSKETASATSRLGSSHKATKASTPISSSSSRSSCSNSSTSSSKCTNRGCAGGGAVGSNASIRSGSGTVQSSRSSTLRGGLVKEGSSTLVSPMLGRAAASSMPSQVASEGNGGGFFLGKEIAVASADTLGDGASQDELRIGGFLRVSGVAESAASAGGSAARRTADSLLEKSDAAVVSTTQGGGKGKGRANTRKCASVSTKASTGAPEKPPVVKAKNRGCPPQPASILVAPAAALAPATPVAGAASATLALPTTTAQAAASPAAIETDSAVSTAHTRSAAAKTAGVVPNIPRIVTHSAASAGGGIAAGANKNGEGTTAGWQRKDTAAAHSLAASLERRCRAARTSPRGLPVPAAGAGAAGSTDATLAGTAPDSGAADGENRFMSYGSCVPQLPVAAPAEAGTGTATRATPAAAPSSTRGGGGKGRGNGAVVLGSPEKVKVTTRAQQESAISALLHAAGAGASSGGGTVAAAHTQQLHSRGERATFSSAIGAGVLASDAAGGGGRVIIEPRGSKEKEFAVGGNSLLQASEETHTERAVLTGKAAVGVAGTMSGGLAAGGTAGAFVNSKAGRTGAAATRRGMTVSGGRQCGSNNRVGSEKYGGSTVNTGAPGAGQKGQKKARAAGSEM